MHSISYANPYTARVDLIGTTKVCVKCHYGLYELVYVITYSTDMTP
jgi:hypothetical protein